VIYITNPTIYSVTGSRPTDVQVQINARILRGRKRPDRRRDRERGTRVYIPLLQSRRRRRRRRRRRALLNPRASLTA